MVSALINCYFVATDYYFFVMKLKKIKMVSALTNCYFVATDYYFLVKKLKKIR